MSSRGSPMIENRRIRKTRALRLPGEVLVEPGDVVAPETPIARARLLTGSPYVIDIGPDLRASDETRIEVNVGDRLRAGDRVARGPVAPFEVTSPIDGLVEYLSRSRGRVYLREEPGSERARQSINIVEALKVWPAVAWMHVRVREGDEIEEGQILAAAPGVDGANYAYTPFGGTVERFDRATGSIIIARNVEEHTVHAQVAGTVESLVDARGAVVHGEVGVMRGVYGSGGEATGRLKVVTETADLAAVEPGTVVALTGTPTADTSRRALDMGVAGLVAGGLDWRDMSETLETDPGFGLVLLAGFGRRPLPRVFVQGLETFDGAMVSITILRDGDAELLFPGVFGADIPRIAVEPGVPQPGDHVRLLGVDALGQMATVQEHVGTVRYPSGMLLDSVRVRRHADDRVETIPLANVELCRTSNAS